MDSLDINNVIDFLRLINSLKHTSRKGWEHVGLQNSESIASHMYGMGIMTFLLGNDSKLDRLRCLQLALVHDMAECIIGDITPHDNVDTETKHCLENVAMMRLTENLGNEVGKLIYDLYEEYEKKETPEARFVKDLDRLDMILTAAEYERNNKISRKLQEFFDSTLGKFNHPFVQKLAVELDKKRKNDDSSKT